MDAAGHNMPNDGSHHQKPTLLCFYIRLRLTEPNDALMPIIKVLQDICFPECLPRGKLGSFADDDVGAASSPRNVLRMLG